MSKDMASVHFSLGENMGETLYFIAIEKSWQ